MKQLILLLPVMVSVLCIISAFLLPVFHRRKLKKPISVCAKVVSESVQRVYKNRSEVLSVAPVLEFETPDGLVRAVSHSFVPEWQYRYRRGEKVWICYDGMDTSKFYICHDRNTEWQKTALLTAGGGILFAYGVLWMKYM